MAYTPYYAPYQRPMMYYNPSIPQEAQPMQSGQPFGQPIQQPQMQQPMQMAQPTPTNDMIWVLSEVEAQSYPVAPNNSVILWDKNNDVIYIKSANMQGVPSMRILDYTERTADNAPKSSDKHECKCGSKFVSIESFNALQSDFEALRNELRNMKEKQITKDMTFSEVNDGE
ncbi:MAG: hypothetical protein U0M02_06905 [Acutalibacteraceae bacterium]|nr:hypothetical protein [Acutalibacteraceae bacterium]